MKQFKKYKLHYWVLLLLFCSTLVLAIAGPTSNYARAQQDTSSTSSCPEGSAQNKEGECEISLPGGGGVITIDPSTGTCKSDSFDIPGLPSIPNPLSWFVCGVTNLAGTGLSMLNTAIKNMFSFDPINGISENEAATAPKLKLVWNSVLNVANLIFVLGLLIIIISQALDFSIFSNYTIKKMVPKLLLGIVLANLSWVFCGILIHFFNLAGNLVGGFILAPVVSQLGTPNGVDLSGSISTVFANIMSNLVIGLMTNPQSAIILILIIFIAALIIALIAFFTLALRRILIIVLIVVAPLACAAWALPGGDKWFSKWWKLFLEMLVMYVFIEAFIALGVFVAALLIVTPIFSSDLGIADDLIKQVNSILALVVLLIPYAMLPMAFKMSSKTLGGVHGAIQGKMTGAVKGKGKEAYGNTGFATDRKNRKSLRDADRQEVSQSRVRKSAVDSGRLGRRKIRPETVQRLDLQQKDYEKKQLEMKQMGADFDMSQEALDVNNGKLVNGKDYKGNLSKHRMDLAAEFNQEGTSTERRRAIAKHISDSQDWNAYEEMQNGTATVMANAGVSMPVKSKLAADMGLASNDTWGNTKANMPSLAVTNQPSDVLKWGNAGTPDSLQANRSSRLGSTKVSALANAKAAALDKLDDVYGAGAKQHFLNAVQSMDTTEASTKSVQDIMSTIAPVHGPPSP